jgi:HAD superfamily hydrolase (TIGR01509 family)
MKNYQRATISLLFIVTYITYIIAKNPQSFKTTANLQPKQSIIFDLTNVVIKENQVEFAKKIGYGVLTRYAITHWKNPGYRCLDMLAAMSKHETQQPHITITLKKRTMPRCIVELQEGKKTCSQVKTEITECIEHLDTQKFFSSAKEKTLMSQIMHLILDPTIIATIIEPIKPTIQLIQKLKSAGHSVYLLANAPEELYSAVHNKYPHIIKLFDGITISSHIKTVKPDHAIFNQLITAHNLNPAECILIDDLEESVTTAKSLGMQGIIFDKISHVTKSLKQRGVKF